MMDPMKSVREGSGRMISRYLDLDLKRGRRDTEVVITILPDVIP